MGVFIFFEVWVELFSWALVPCTLIFGKSGGGVGLKSVVEKVVAKNLKSEGRDLEKCRRYQEKVQPRFRSEVPDIQKCQEQKIVIFEKWVTALKSFPDIKRVPPDIQKVLSRSKSCPKNVKLVKSKPWFWKVLLTLKKQTWS